MDNVEIVVPLAGNITDLQADAILLKNVEEGLYGPELAVNKSLGGLLAVHQTSEKTAVGHAEFIRVDRGIAAGGILLVGVGSGQTIGYRVIETMAHRAIEEIARLRLPCRSLATVSHAVGFGLDREEVFYTQLFAFKKALEAHPLPLETILFSEFGGRDRERLVTYLEKLVLDAGSPVRKEGQRFVLSLGTHSRTVAEVTARLNRAESVFLAMPFDQDFENVYDFGLRLPIIEAGYQPIRLDKKLFLGSISREIQERIRDAVAVIADISDHNPNVLFELGFAQGAGKPTIVICRQGQDVAFDVRDMNVVFYNPQLLRDLNGRLKAILAEVPR
jgi:hypothetical protein